MLKLKGYIVCSIWKVARRTGTGNRRYAGHLPTGPPRMASTTFMALWVASRSIPSARLFNDTKAIEPPRDPRYHLTEDLTKQTINWIQQQHAAAPKKPFFVLLGTRRCAFTAPSLSRSGRTNTRGSLILGGMPIVSAPRKTEGFRLDSQST